MIILKELRWSNAFSYGANNKLSFASNPLTQLVGKNGHGKSSIALILEEVLFNKNSKGIKKGDILNRYVKDKSYSIELDFEKDNDEYTIKTTRSSTQSVKLIKNGEDISSHTATGTYKLIEELIGIDHKAFSQIVYQSSASSLEFLTATDANRKKFLIELLNLGMYTRGSEIFKALSVEVSREVSAAEGKISTIRSWLDKYKDTNLSEQPIRKVPTIPTSTVNEEIELSAQLSIIEQSNKKIAQNNTYRTLQSKIKLLPLPPAVEDSATKIKTAVSEASAKTAEAKAAKAMVDKLSKLHGKCPTCLQDIDEAMISSIIAENNAISSSAIKTAEELNLVVEEIEKAVEAHSKAVKSQEDWEKYHQLIDNTLPQELLDKESLENKLTEIKLTISNIRLDIKKAEEYNAKANAHNAKVVTISEQLSEFSHDLETHTLSLNTLSARLNILNILNKTFSTTGLVAYKIECLVKDLEELTNAYLVDMSDGRFQICFQISSSDKLNVIITDNGKDIDILALSGGERARVNVSALLAIRKLMQSLSNSRINLLILDETVEALDVEGKEKLIEVLLKEESLNTFLVSHGFTHPLLEKVSIIKENNISRIEV